MSGSRPKSSFAYVVAADRIGVLRILRGAQISPVELGSEQGQLPVSGLIPLKA
jgi:hypothetical protein